MAEATQTLEQTLLELVRQLPPEIQKQALDFIRFLEQESHKDHEHDAKWELLFSSQASNVL